MNVTSFLEADAVERWCFLRTIGSTDDHSYAEFHFLLTERHFTEWFLHYTQRQWPVQFRLVFGSASTARAVHHFVGLGYIRFSRVRDGNGPHYPVDRNTYDRVLLWAVGSGKGSR